MVVVRISVNDLIHVKQMCFVMLFFVTKEYVRHYYNNHSTTEEMKVPTASELPITLTKRVMENDTDANTQNPKQHFCVDRCLPVHGLIF